MRRAMPRIGFCLLLAFIGLLAFGVLGLNLTTEVEGATIIVDEVGQGDYISIQTAVDNANDGDTVRVWNGTYNEDVHIDKPLSLVGNGTSNTIINGTKTADVINVTANWVNISGVNITTNYVWTDYSGIRIYKASYCNVSEVYVYMMKWGVLFQESSWNILLNSTVSSAWNNILIQSSNNNTIEGNNVTSGMSWGLHSRDSWDNIISNNTFHNHNFYEFTMEYSTGTTLVNNTFKTKGIDFLGDKKEHWNTHTIPLTNTVQGDPVTYWKNQVGGVVPLGAGQVILANCTGVTVEGQNLSNVVAGIQLGHSSQNNIWNNTLDYDIYGLVMEGSNWNYIYNNSASLGPYRGIYLFNSENNSFASNNASLNKWDGFYLKQSGNNTVIDCIVNDNGREGLYLDFSNYTTLIDNNFRNNPVDIYLWNSGGSTLTGNIMENRGIALAGNTPWHWNSHTMDTSNLVNGKPVRYIVGQNGGTVPTDAGQIILANCTGVTLQGHNISNTYTAVHIGYSSGTVAQGNSLSGNAQGIYMHRVDGGIITSNNLTSNSYNNIVLHYSTYNMISFNNVSDVGNYGINFYKSENNSIESNYGDMGGARALHIYNSPNNDIRNNTFVQGMIHIDSSGGGVIANNNLTGKGISFYRSPFSLIENNTVTGAGSYGLYLFGSDNTTIINNVLNDNSKGISFYDSSDCLIINNDISRNTGGTGIFMGSLSNRAVIVNNTINSNSGDGIQLGGKGYTIKNNTLTSNGQYGVYLSSVENSVIENNLIDSSAFTGVYLYVSNNILIFNNDIISGGSTGLSLYKSSYVTATGNTIISNSGVGIYLDESSNNTITSNDASGNSQGIYMIKAHHNTITGNDFGSSGSFGLFISESTHNSLSYNLINSNAGSGIQFQADSQHNVFSYNEMNFNGGKGIFVVGSVTDNIFSHNTFESNAGLGYNNMGGTSGGNLFYHNSFINNNGGGTQVDDASVNTWNLSYPEGGNYWSTYAGTDLYHGPFQNIGGSDTFGDTAHPINGGNTDQYPMMHTRYLYNDVEVFIMEPDDGERVSGPVLVTAQASPEFDSHMLFLIDGILHSYDNTAPFQAVVNTSLYPDGAPITIIAQGAQSHSQDEVVIVPMNNVATGDFISARSLKDDYIVGQDISVIVDVINSPPEFDSMSLWVRCTDSSGDRLHNAVTIHPYDTQYRAIIHLPSDSVHGQYFVSIEGMANYMDFSVWNASATTTFNVTGTSTHEMLDDLGAYLENVNSTLLDVIVELDGAINAFDGLNGSIGDFVDDLDSLNSSLTSVLADLDMALFGVNSSLHDTLSGLDGSILTRLSGVNSSLADNIQTSMQSIIDKLASVNGSLSGQIGMLATSANVNDLQAWLDTVLDSLDNELESTKQTLLGQMTDLEMETATQHDDLVLEITKALINLHSLQTTLDGHDDEMSNSILDLQSLLGDIDSISLTEVRQRLHAISGNISQFSQDIGDDLTDTADDVIVFEVETQARLDQINETLKKLSTLQEILDDLDGLDVELEQVENELKGDIENSDSASAGLDSVIIILLVLVIAFAGLSLFLGLKAQKGNGDVSIPKEDASMDEDSGMEEESIDHDDLEKEEEL